MSGLTADQIADAKVKYHLLITGQLPRVAVDGLDGSRLEFQGVTATALLEYIRSQDPTFLADNAAAAVNRPFRYFF